MTGPAARATATPPSVAQPAEPVAAPPLAAAVLTWHDGGLRAVARADTDEPDTDDLIASTVFAEGGAANRMAGVACPDVGTLVPRGWSADHHDEGLEFWVRVLDWRTPLVLEPVEETTEHVPDVEDREEASRMVETDCELPQPQRRVAAVRSARPPSRAIPGELATAPTRASAGSASRPAGSAVVG